MTLESFIRFFEIRRQNLRQLLFFIVADQNIRRQRLLQTLRRCLHIAACRNDHRLGIALSRPVQHLPGLSVSHVRHRTRIDDIYICLSLKRHDLIAVFFQKLLHRLRLICVDFTAQIMQCCFSHRFFPFRDFYMNSC